MACVLKCPVDQTTMPTEFTPYLSEASDTQFILNLVTLGRPALGTNYLTVLIITIAFV